MGIIFAIVAIALYNSSLVELDRDTARIMGTEYVANVQKTVFSAACAVMCVINFVGAFIISAIESNSSPMPSFKGPKNTDNIIKEREKARDLLGGR